MSREEMNDEFSGIEAALASLRPAPPQLDRDRTMFEAGWSAAQSEAGHAAPESPGRRKPRMVFPRNDAELPARGVWLWPASTALSLAVAVALAALLAVRDGAPVVGSRRPVEPEAVPVGAETPALVDLPDEPAPTRGDDLAAGSLALRRLVLANGVEALPDPKPSSGSRPESPPWRAGSRDRLERWLFDEG